MPNWSYNSFSASGTEESMKEFREAATKGGKFAFSNFFPMPEKIKNTISPSSSAKGVMWMNEDRAAAKREGDISEILGVEPEGLIPCENNTEEKCRALIAEFGTDNWYDWNVQTYGTKWDVTCDDYEDSPTEFCASFDTAWSPPLQFLESIQAKYPDIDFSMSYEIEGGDGCGLASTDRSSGSPVIEVEEGELEYESGDGRPISFDEDQEMWVYDDDGEECDDLIWVNPFTR